MSVLITNKAAKRAARISSRLLSRKFLDKLRDIYMCKHEFLDLEARVDNQNQDTVPVLLRAIQGRAERTREEASTGYHHQSVLKVAQRSGLVTRSGNPFATTASIFQRSNESQLALPLMRSLESTRSRLQN